MDDAFWAHVDKSGGPDACWPWTGGCYPNGYGRYEVTREDGKRRVWLAHRYAFQDATGIPLKRNDRVLLVQHGCDNPPCCNPYKCLSLGFAAKNTRDMLKRGRGIVGAQHANAKLSDEAVREIRASTETHKALAERFGVCYQAIQHVRKGRQWRHVL